MHTMKIKRACVVLLGEIGKSSLKGREGVFRKKFWDFFFKKGENTKKKERKTREEKEKKRRGRRN